MVCNIHAVFQNDKIKEVEIIVTCIMHTGNKKWIQYFSYKRS
jgi:hypothetical protein